mmetsp:Transcript_15196/g.23668  ORF Transcript_15196/g.23668 Transcript_15196/m.23668 type:complete len:155 (+) Transcript_15196:119-583(+)
MRLEYIQELKRRFEDEKRSLETELVRMHDGLRNERAKRVEAEAAETGLRQEVDRLSESYKALVAKNQQGAERLKEQSEKIRDIQRQNSTLTILLSEIQPRLTVLEQDVLSSSKIDPEVMPSMLTSTPTGMSATSGGADRLSPAFSNRDDEVIMA